MTGIDVQNLPAPLNSRGKAGQRDGRTGLQGVLLIG